MSKKRLVLTLASALGIGVLAFTGGSASAMTIPSAHQTAAAGTLAGADLLTEAHATNNGQSGQFRRWDSRRDGQRCASRRGNCRHYYQGYYYVSPWWMISRPSFFGGVYYGNTYGYQQVNRSRHVQWCYNNYRSYDVRYNTWVAYSGRVYQCRSPY